MFSKDRWDEILEALNSNKFRTLLTAFGVFWGITILVLLLALTNGLKNGVMSDFGDFATNSMFMWTQGTSKPYKGLPKGRNFNYKLDDVQAIKSEISNIKYASPRNQLGGFMGNNNVIRGTKTGAFEIYGDYPEYIKQQPLDILQGRFISYSDIHSKRKVCVIGTDVIKGLYNKDEEPLGTYIKINGVNFMVVGVFKMSNSQGDNQQDANTIYMPFTTFGQAFNRGDEVGWMAITAVDDVPITSIKQQVFDLMKFRHKIDPTDERAIGHFDLSEQFEKVNGLFTILTIVGYFVGALVLMSGIIGISNIMLIVVKERTKEIGIRRALGATPWVVKSQILQESLILTILAGMVGISFSAAIIWVLNYLLDMSGPVENFANPSVSMGVVFVALFILVVSGLLAGLIPANSATKMKPVDALRIE
ncbi:MAG: ABC transporter permease [Flavobacteriales bacterium]|nr:ABC transporter permease [Flavobacteriales bacterium]PIV92428.1 MAG: multidrug ABC transporter ATP-binding protein [Flavobacteriaceae bacterium CG17_big_fil_post_rev_8_21_14_2_50_33_15]PIY10409.1 MAG: multidrug ABC transporter ATP-binding protein [Flavobacteriaceae bacterium CG_4_10_14_3_um_filter_33_47]PJB20434.1 MAG: multidrug ABC transporter ATP-binding protein [Flavobacteriaceae bacterium CG_4_9_14_3_um_filter_33_16]